MRKFKVYQVIAIVYLCAYIAMIFFQTRYPDLPSAFRSLLLFTVFLLFCITHISLVSVLNYFKQPSWKKALIVWYVIGIFIFNFLTFAWWQFGPASIALYLITCLPLSIAILSIRAEEIKSLLQSYAFTMLMICFMRIVIPFVRNANNL